MKKLLLPTIAALGLASSAAFVQPALAMNGMGTHGGPANVFVGCTVSSTTPFLSFTFLQASGVNITPPTSGSTNCADAVAAVEALGLHVVAEETAVVGSAGGGSAAAGGGSTTFLIIHLDNTNTNTGGNIGGHTGSNFGGNTGGNSGH